jgi:hypothetical protein
MATFEAKERQKRDFCRKNDRFFAKNCQFDVKIATFASKVV